MLETALQGILFTETDHFIRWSISVQPNSQACRVIFFGFMISHPCSYTIRQYAYTEASCASKMMNLPLVPPLRAEKVRHIIASRSALTDFRVSLGRVQENQMHCDIV